MEVKAKVREFIGENFYVSDPAMLGDDASFLEQGIVDSTGILEVVSFLEGEFGIEIDDDDLVPENLDSIAAVAAFVARKQSG